MLRSVEKENNTAVVCVCNTSQKQNFFHEFKEVQDINPQNYPALYPKPYDDTEYALKILEHHGYCPKVFCLAEKNDHNAVFEVKSDQWNWNVIPITLEDTTDIPAEYLEAIGILVNYKVPIKSVALASPMPVECSGEVICEECVHELKALAQTATVSFLLLAELLRSSIDLLNTPSTNASLVTLKKIPDPALLVRVKTNWIEIGRW